ncbi:energy transducer TonB [Bacteroidales bacterium OttesenSCG-928-K03]|nr:energy transducer TonB [Odoribacter sp. OttesenSCG-928-L07]MDL2240802.1 energy transducer TonB [Bacteroidales bacterium OttesenSCG-928-K22]MDL2242777.1 energy transducer TonB [Bacteroidales bacterium OttesenSCG-928-K03]
MDKRKTSKSDLEGKQMIFVEIGLIIALAVCLVAFEWKKYDIQKVDIEARADIEVMEEIVLQTKQEKPPPPPKQVPPTTTLLNIVENEVEIETDIIVDVEMSENLELEEYVPYEVEEEEVNEAEIFLIVEKQPTFPGGEVARLKYLRDNVKYPQIAKESGIQGTVYIQFVIEPDGSVSNVIVQRGIGGGCDEEAVRVIKNMPKWSPGEQRGKKVRVQFSMQVKFTLQGS